MNSVTVRLENTNSDVWKSLPAICQNLLANHALNSILNGTPYPTGTDQLELAIELAENGVSAETVCKLSGLHKSVFEAFIG